jgi:hypothetical protein
MPSSFLRNERHSARYPYVFLVPMEGLLTTTSSLHDLFLNRTLTSPGA